MSLIQDAREQEKKRSAEEQEAAASRKVRDARTEANNAFAAQAYAVFRDTGILAALQMFDGGPYAKYSLGVTTDAFPRFYTELDEYGLKFPYGEYPSQYHRESGDAEVNTIAYTLHWVSEGHPNIVIPPGKINYWKTKRFRVEFHRDESLTFVSALGSRTLTASEWQTNGQLVEQCLDEAHSHAIETPHQRVGEASTSYPW